MEPQDRESGPTLLEDVRRLTQGFKSEYQQLQEQLVGIRLMHAQELNTFETDLQVSLELHRQQ